MTVKFERLPQANNDLALNNDLTLTNDQLLAIEKDCLSAPLKSGGSFGPISWDADFQDISKSYAYIKVSVLGINIIDGGLDASNPKISVDLTVAGVGVKAEVGIDFDRCRIYFKGTLNFVFYKTDYDFTILNF